jgi:hypothetical protein
MRKFKPDMYKKNIYDINYKKLKQMGKKYIFFDVDNTLISYLESKPIKENKKLFDKLKKMGFEVFLFSNSHDKRINPFKEYLEVNAYTGSMKPLKKNYKKVLKKYNKEECVFIGDQIMTDVIGAKRNGLFVIFLDRINDNEPIYTRFWRFFESFILKDYEKKEILVKGKYYE